MATNQVRLVFKKKLTQDLAIFRFKHADNSLIGDFKPGQFVNLGIQLSEKETIFRSYSMSSPPHEKNYYEFYIKHKEHPVLGKFTTILFEININDTLLFQKPRGAFTIEEEKPDGSQETRQMVLVASGAGLAPFMSYILHLKKIGTQRKIVLLHGVSYAAELGYKEQLEKLASKKDEMWDFTYIPTVSRPHEVLSKNWKGNTGRVENLINGIEKHYSKLENILGFKVTPENSIFYVCGYKNLIDYVSTMLLPLGFVDNRHKRSDGSFDIKYEQYGV